MRVNKDSLKKFLFALATWCLLLGGGIALERWTTLRVTLWIQICALVMSSLTVYFIWRKTGRISYAQWLWLAGPYLASLLLARKMETVLRASGPATEPAIDYLIYCWTFVAVILLWIVGFPYEDIWGPHSKRHRFGWKIGLSVVAMGVAGLTLRHGLQITHGSTIAHLSEIQTLYVWTQEIIVAVYVLLVARLLLPLSLSLAAASLKIQGPPEEGGGSVTAAR